MQKSLLQAFRLLESLLRLRDFVLGALTRIVLLQISHRDIAGLTGFGFWSSYKLLL